MADDSPRSAMPAVVRAESKQEALSESISRIGGTLRDNKPFADVTRRVTVSTTALSRLSSRERLAGNQIIAG